MRTSSRMTSIELIDRLCAVVEAQAKIIREQALFIEQMQTVDQETKEKFAEKRDAADAELDLLEYELRPIRGTVCECED